MDKRQLTFVGLIFLAIWVVAGGFLLTQGFALANASAIGLAFSLVLVCALAAGDLYMRHRSKNSLGSVGLSAQTAPSAKDRELSILKDHWGGEPPSYIDARGLIAIQLSNAPSSWRKNLGLRAGQKSLHWNGTVKPMLQKESLIWTWNVAGAGNISSDEEEKRLELEIGCLHRMKPLGGLVIEMDPDTLNADDPRMKLIPVAFRLLAPILSASIPTFILVDISSVPGIDQLTRIGAQGREAGQLAESNTMYNCLTVEDGRLRPQAWDSGVHRLWAQLFRSPIATIPQEALHTALTCLDRLGDIEERIRTTVPTITSTDAAKKARPSAVFLTGDAGLFNKGVLDKILEEVPVPRQEPEIEIAPPASSHWKTIAGAAGVLLLGWIIGWLSAVWVISNDPRPGPVSHWTIETEWSVSKGHTPYDVPLEQFLREAGVKGEISDIKGRCEQSSKRLSAEISVNGTSVVVRPTDLAGDEFAHVFVTAKDLQVEIILTVHVREVAHLPGKLRGFLRHSSGDIYVSTIENGANGLLRISQSDGSVEALPLIDPATGMRCTLATPQGICEDPQNHHLIVCDYGTSQLLDVDPIKRTRTVIADLDGQPVDVAYCSSLYGGTFCCAIVYEIGHRSSIELVCRSNSKRDPNKPNKWLGIGSPTHDIGGALSCLAVRSIAGSKAVDLWACDYQNKTTYYFEALNPETATAVGRTNLNLGPLSDKLSVAWNGELLLIGDKNRMISYSPINGIQETEELRVAGIGEETLGPIRVIRSHDGGAFLCTSSDDGNGSGFVLWKPHQQSAYEVVAGSVTGAGLGAGFRAFQVPHKVVTKCVISGSD